MADIREIVGNHLNIVLPARDKDRRAAMGRLAQLKAESDKLLQAYYADAIDVDHLREEQTRIAASRAGLERRLGQSQLAVEQIHAAFERCCELLLSAHDHYLVSDDNGRRDLNQAVFERIYIRDDEVVGSDLTPVFHRLLDDDLAATLEHEVPKDLTSNVRTSGLFLVPANPGPSASDQTHPTGQIRARARRQAVRAHVSVRLGRERPFGPLSWEQKNPRPCEAEGSNVSLLVGVTGFEPAASSSRTTRATKLRHTPWHVIATTAGSTDPEIAAQPQG